MPLSAPAEDAVPGTQTRGPGTQTRTPGTQTRTPVPGTQTRTPVPASRTPAPPAEPASLAGSRRQPALIVDPDDQDDETGVFDQPSALRGRDPSAATPADRDEDEGEDVRTRALMVDLPEGDSEPVVLPLPGSR